MIMEKGHECIVPLNCNVECCLSETESQNVLFAHHAHPDAKIVKNVQDIKQIDAQMTKQLPGLHVPSGHCTVNRGRDLSGSVEKWS